MTVTLADGISFTINKHKEIERSLRNGVDVEVKIEPAADGTHYATEIQVRNQGEEDEHREEHDLIELSRVINDLSGTELKSTTTHVLWNYHRL